MRGVIASDAILDKMDDLIEESNKTQGRLVTIVLDEDETVEFLDQAIRLVSESKVQMTKNIIPDPNYPYAFARTKEVKSYFYRGISIKLHDWS